MERFLLSVCIITYNHGKYIREAIEGVLMQKVNFNFEIIIADDYSLDDTRQIIIEYKEKFPKLFKIILQERNVGAAQNWYDLLSMAKAKYISYFEGDDYWVDPLKLQKQINILESNEKYSACVHQTQLLIKGKLGNLFNENVPQIIKMNDLYEGRLFHTASCIFKKSVLDYFPKNSIMMASGDRFLNFCIAIKGPIYFMEETMCIYRKHDKGISSNMTPKKLLLDLNTIQYLKTIYTNFAVLRYKSYVYATAGLIKNINFFTKFYLLSISFILSFSIFPKNIKIMLNYFSKKHEH